MEKNPTQKAEPSLEFTWILQEDFRTTENDVRKVFSSWGIGISEAVEFTDLDGVRQTLVMSSPDEI